MGIFEIQLDWDIGRIYINDGKYDNATRIFKAISKFSPVTSALALGEIYGKENNPEKAFIAFSRAIFLDNQSAAAWRNRGMALLELKRYNEALDSCNKSLNLTNETDAEAWFNKGLIYMEKGEFAKAEDMFNRSLSIEPNNYREWANKGLAIMDNEKNKNYTEAELSFKKSLKLNPQSSGAWLNLGIALEELRLYDESLAAYDQATEMNNGSKSAWENKMKILDRLKFQSEASIAHKIYNYLNKSKEN